MELLLYRSATDDMPFQVVTLTPRIHRDSFFWHVALAGLPVGTLYTWRVTGPTANGSVEPLEVLDPFARAISSVGWNRNARVAGAPPSRRR